MRKGAVWSMNRTEWITRKVTSTHKLNKQFSWRLFSWLGKTQQQIKISNVRVRCWNDANWKEENVFVFVFILRKIGEKEQEEHTVCGRSRWCRAAWGWSLPLYFYHSMKMCSCFFNFICSCVLVLFMLKIHSHLCSFVHSDFQTFIILYVFPSLATSAYLQLQKLLK